MAESSVPSHLDLFRTDGPRRAFCHTRCKVCGMSSLGGVSWYRGHKCPEPFPPEAAQSIWNNLTRPGAPPVSPTFKARLQMSWRHGYIKTFAERATDQMEQEFR